jgi:hypothetical protein
MFTVYFDARSVMLVLKVYIHGSVVRTFKLLKQNKELIDSS